MMYDAVEPVFSAAEPVFSAAEFVALNPHYIEGSPSMKGIPFVDLIANNVIIGQLSLGDNCLQVKLPVLAGVKRSEFERSYVKSSVKFGSYRKVLRGKDYSLALQTMVGFVVEAIQNHSHTKELGCEYLSGPQDEEVLRTFAKMCLDSYRARR